MHQQNFHSTNVTPPPTELPILRKIIDAYKIWHMHHAQMERLSRYTLGATIDKTFCETIEFILQAGYSVREQKYAVVLRAVSKLDTLKFFLQVAWEIKVLDHKKFAAISEPISEIGKMLGGWRKQLQNNEPLR